MKLEVFSEIGRLRAVMTHRPGPEVDRMPPALMEHLLFDDILHGPSAREEHDAFTRAIEAFGVRNLDFQDLLCEALAQDVERTRRLVDRVVERERLPSSVAARLRELDPADLCEALVHGVAADHGGMSGDYFFDVYPLPNLLMSRDPQVVLGNGVIIASMSRSAREREADLSRFVCATHPELRDNPHWFDFDLDESAAGAARFGALTLEGGDVLVFQEGVVCVGISERTMERAIDLLADTLRGLDRFSHLIMVRMPSSRSQMHLDTICTRISEGECLVYPPMFEQGYAETLSVVSLELGKNSSDIGRRHRSFLEACRAAGVDLEPVPCGGPDDHIQQTREQWTDGANSFALAPGLIVLYDRNEATLEELDKRGYGSVSAESFTGNAERYIRGLDEGRRYVITLTSAELSRARGGPRCMTMPLIRDPV